MSTWRVEWQNVAISAAKSLLQSLRVRWVQPFKNRQNTRQPWDRISVMVLLSVYRMTLFLAIYCNMPDMFNQNIHKWMFILIKFRMFWSRVWLTKTLSKIHFLRCFLTAHTSMFICLITYSDELVRWTANKKITSVFWLRFSPACYLYRTMSEDEQNILLLP